METIKKIVLGLYSPSGRINRAKYIVISLCVIIYVFIIMGIISIFPASENTLFLILSLSFIFVLIPIQICNVIKRLHDTNRSGWWWFIGLMPYIGPLILLYFLLIEKGTNGPNQYGEDPLKINL